MTYAGFDSLCRRGVMARAAKEVNAVEQIRAPLRAAAAAARALAGRCGTEACA